MTDILEEAFKITRDWIFKHRTKAGGWTGAQLTALGIQWGCNKKGWISDLEGSLITKEMAKSFEDSKFIKANQRKSTLRKDCQERVGKLDNRQIDLLILYLNKLEK